MIEQPKGNETCDHNHFTDMVMLKPKGIELRCSNCGHLRGVI